MIRDITIHAVLNGYIVSVGCQQVVFENTADMCTEIDKYLNNPDETEKKYQELPNAKHVLEHVLAGNPGLAPPSQFTYTPAATLGAIPAGPVGSLGNCGSSVHNLVGLGR